jgi:histidinol phosphatase-like enzyme
LWLDTALEDAQVNAVWRIVREHGRLLTPEELRASRDPAVLTPSAQFRALRELEPPTLAEGLSSIDVVSFARAPAPAPAGRALILWCDGVLRRSRSGAARPSDAGDVEPIVSRRDMLSQHARDGWRLLAMSWEPEVTEQGRPPRVVDEAFARLREALAVEMEHYYCPHGAGPPVCWCRKPLPGLGVLMTHRHALDPAQCIYVGASAQDATFAKRVGFEYRAAAEFFGDGSVSAPPRDCI